MSSILRRRLWAGAILSACLALCLFASAASALRLDTSTDTMTTLDSDAHWWETLKTVTVGGYQYTAYWDAADREGHPYVQLSRRRLSDNNVKTIRFEDEESWLRRLNDGHNFVGLGINPNDGTIHISWSLHGRPETERRHYYWHSATRCTERTQEEFSQESCGFRFSHFQANATIEESMTYPFYINDNRGRLYFTWRYDDSAHGDQILNSYDEATQTWTMRGRVLRGRRWGEVPNTYEFEITGTRYRTTQRGVYPIGWVFDKNERLHVAWVWREEVPPLVIQHGLHYAYSDDWGANWYTDTGERRAPRRIAETEEDPIDINDLRDTQVVLLPPGWFMWGGGMTVDSDNNPHIFVPSSDIQTNDITVINERHKHYWRTNDGSWYSGFIEPAESGTNHPATPGIFMDRANNVYTLFSRDEIGWTPWNARVYVQEDLPMPNVTWQPNGERDGYLDVQLKSANTCLDTVDFLNLPISTSGTTQLRMRARNNTTSTGITVSWTTTESTGWSIARQQRFTRSLTANDRSYSEYTFTITDADWRGTLREFEICVDGPSTGSVSFDSISLTDRSARAAKTWGFTRGATLYAAEASPADNWLTWSSEVILPGVSITREDAYWVTDPKRYAESRVVEFATQTQGTPGIETVEVRSFDIVGDDVAKDWRFDADLIGWTAQRDISSFAQSTDEGNKVAGGTLTGSDSRILSTANLKIPTEGAARTIHVTMKNSTRSTTGHIYFITDSDRTFNETKSQTFTTRAESGYTTYDIDMSRVSGWSRSTLYQLRLDPSDDATRTGSFKVDRIWITD